MKIVRIGVLVSMILILLCSPVVAAGRFVSKVSVSDASPEVGQVVTATVMVDMRDAMLGSYSAELDWNAAVLAYVGASGPPAGFMGVVNDTKAANGHLRFNGASARGASGDVELLTVTFAVVGRGHCALDLNYTAMAEAGTFANLLPSLRVRDGSVRVRR